MQIHIQSLGFTLTEGLREQTERRLRLALGSVTGHVREVAIRLTDVNGPRGGVDKRCTLRARMEGSPTVVIEQQDADLYVAIDHAAARLRRTVSRRLDKIQGRRRFPDSRWNDEASPGLDH